MSPREVDSPPNIFYAIVTDLHFWIPFTVFLGGLILLDKLR
jgi:hypothetical protein